MGYQVWGKDRYNRHEILTILSKKGIPESEWATAKEAYEAAKRYVHDKNRNNPLTFDDQKKDPKYVVALAKADGDAYYAGNLIMGRHKTIVASASGEVETPLSGTDVAGFYLGQDPDDKPWILQTPRKQPITSLEDPSILEKTIVFIHQLRGINRI